MTDNVVNMFDKNRKKKEKAREKSEEYDFEEVMEKNKKNDDHRSNQRKTYVVTE